MRTVEDAYQATLSRAQHLKDQGCHMVEMWECQMKRELRHNPQMRAFFNTVRDIPDPMDHREALRGGMFSSNFLSFFYWIYTNVFQAEPTPLASTTSAAPTRGWTMWMCVVSILGV